MFAAMRKFPRGTILLNGMNLNAGPVGMHKINCCHLSSSTMTAVQSCCIRHFSPFRVNNRSN